METPDKTIKYNLFDYAYYVGRSFILPWLDGSSVVIYPLMMVIALLLPSFCDGVLGISGDTIPLIILSTFSSVSCTRGTTDQYLSKHILMRQNGLNGI